MGVMVITVHVTTPFLRPFLFHSNAGHNITVGHRSVEPNDRALQLPARHDDGTEIFATIECTCAHVNKPSEKNSD